MFHPYIHEKNDPGTEGSDTYVEKCHNFQDSKNGAKKNVKQKLSVSLKAEDRHTTYHRTFHSREVG